MELSREGRSPNKTSKKSDGQCNKEYRAESSKVRVIIFNLPRMYVLKERLNQVIIKNACYF